MSLGRSRKSADKARPPKGRQDNIDLLRALAIVAVIAFHYTSAFPVPFYKTSAMPFTFKDGGYGVDLFFAVSGFCIFMTMERSATWQNFLARRLARLQPAYLLAVPVTWVTIHLGRLPGAVSAKAAVGNLFWLEVIPGVPLVDGAYWSLVVELKFYLLIGILFYLSRGRSIAAKWAAFALIGTLLSMDRGIPAMISKALLIGPYAAAFLVGLLAWEWRRLPNGERWPLALVTIALLFLSPRFGGESLIGPLIGVFAFLVLQWRSLKVPRAITYIGLVSYSLYLFHQNIGYVAIRELAPLPIELRQIAAVAFVFGIAVLSYHFVERTFEKWVLLRAESTIGACRHALRIPYRNVPNPALNAELRAW